MLDICNNITNDNFIAFSKKETVCIKFGELIKPQEYAKLDVRYLGNYLNSALDNFVYSNIKYSQFIG